MSCLSLLILMMFGSGLLESFVVGGRGRPQVWRNLMQRRNYQNVISVPMPSGAFRYLQKEEMDVDSSEKKFLNHLAMLKNYQQEYFNNKLMKRNRIRYSDEENYINFRRTNPFYQNLYNIYITDSPVFLMSYFMLPDRYKSLASQAPTVYNSSFIFNGYFSENSPFNDMEKNKKQHYVDEERSTDFSGIHSRDDILTNDAERKKILQEIIKEESGKIKNITVHITNLWKENSTHPKSQIAQKKLKTAEADVESYYEKWMISLFDESKGGDVVTINMTKQFDAAESQNNTIILSHSLPEKKTVNNTEEDIIGTNFPKSTGESVSLRGIKSNATINLSHTNDEENESQHSVWTESFQNFRNKKVIPVYGPDYKNSSIDNQSYVKYLPANFVFNLKKPNSSLKRNPLWHEFVHRERYAGNVFTSNSAESKKQIERKNNAALFPSVLKKPVIHDWDSDDIILLTNNSEPIVDKKEEAISELHQEYDNYDIYLDYGESESNDAVKNMDNSRSITSSEEENTTQLRGEELKVHQDEIYGNFHSQTIPMNKHLSMERDNSDLGEKLWPENYSPKIQHLKNSSINNHHPEKERSSNASSANREEVSHQKTHFQKTSAHKEMGGRKKFSHEKSSTNRDHNIHHTDKAEKAQNRPFKSHVTHGKTSAEDDSSKTINHKSQHTFEGDLKISTEKILEKAQTNKEVSEKGAGSMDPSIHKNSTSTPSEIEAFPEEPSGKSEGKSSYNVPDDIAAEINEKAYDENNYGDYGEGLPTLDSIFDSAQNENSFIEEYNEGTVNAKKAKGKTDLDDRLHESSRRTDLGKKNPEDEDHEEMLRRILKPKSLVGSPWRTPHIYLNSDLLKGNTFNKN